MSDLGDRMKRYEQPYYLVRRVPVIIRVDGRAFHTLTRGLEKPFDDMFIKAMVGASKLTAKDMMGFKLGYVQSDEASFLLTDYDTLETEPWFDYNRSKVESISAANMTSNFNLVVRRMGITAWRSGTFDARAFNVPIDDVANYFLWRAKDWERNSLNMYCGAFFSPKRLKSVRASERHDMLHSIGKNWATDLSEQVRNGTFVVRYGRTMKELTNVIPRFIDIESVLKNVLSG